MLLEGERLAFGASGRNGGFCSASLTHGIENGLARWPDELAALERMGRENLDGDRATHRAPRDRLRLGGDGHDRRRDRAARAAVAGGGGRARCGARLGRRAARRARGARAGRLADVPRRAVARATARALVDPARLCWGLRARRRRPAPVYEGTPVPRWRATAPASAPTRRAAACSRAARCWPRAPSRRWSARSAATSCRSTTTCSSPSRCRRRSAPRSAGTAARASPTRRTSSTTTAMTDDDRILWGGYDAVYDFARPRRRPSATSARRPSTLLAEHFSATFPQLEGLGFSHRWGGAIDTCSRFSRARGAARSAAARSTPSASPASASARAASAPASRSTSSTAPTRSARGWRWSGAGRSRSRPSRARWAGIKLTRRALARADPREGRRGPWLRVARPPRPRVRLLSG